MLHRNSLKLRYWISFLVILVPVVLFLTILNHVTTDNNRRYINQAELERFTYAAEGFSALLDRLDYTAAAARELETSIVLDETGRAYVPNTWQAVAALERLESSLAQDVHACLYLRGDKYIYTSAGQQLYSDFELSMSGRYNLTMSGLYSKLMSVSATREIKAVMDREGRDGALAYIVPFPAEPLPAQAMLLFLVPAEALRGEFENYIGELNGDLYIYNSFLQPVFSLYASQSTLPPLEQLLKIRGVGVQETGDGVVRITVANSKRGLNCMLVMDSDTLYDGAQQLQNQLLMLDVVLIALLAVLFVWLTLFNYQPVRQLVHDVVGKPDGRLQTNELELIRDFHRRTVDELESRNIQISEMTPMITQQLVMKLVRGEISQKAQLDAFSRYVGICLNRTWLAVLYVLVPEKDADVDLPRLARLAVRMQHPQAVMLPGELPHENALCIILHYDAEDTPQETCLGIARALYTELAHSGLQETRIGVGGSYTDADRMVDSFAEASAAAHMTGAALEAVRHYEPQNAPTQEQGWRGLPPLALSLLSEAVSRGENAVACRAAAEIIDELSGAAPSLMFFRYYGTELVNQLMKLANQMHVAVEQKQLQVLISYQSKAEFSQAVLQFTALLCESARRLNEETSSAERNRLLAYVMEHYTEFDLSIQSTADELGMQKSKITTIIRESMGMNFVQYVSGLRMNEFKRLLRETDRTITELVSAIGYSDVPNFLRKFKTVEGITAGQYRAEARKNA